MLSYDGVPQVLKDLPQWIVWKLERRKGQPTKVPYDAKKAGAFAKSNDPSTWASFDKALEVAGDVLNDYDGVGFMLQGTDLVGIDFDGVIHDGIAEPFVLEILSKLGSPYAEITPSGNGLRAFVHCDKLPDGQRKFSGNKYGAEIYSGAEGGRYLTVTSNHFSGSGVPEIKDISLPYFMVSQIRNEKLKKLWMGDLSGYPSQSEADLALCGILAKLFNNDRATVEWAFRSSKLAEREKWTEREDYRDWTLTKACGGKPETKEAPGDAPPAEETLPDVNWRNGADIKPKRIQWLWQSRVPIGKLTLFCGNPDNGKSLATTSLAAIVSTGKNFPNGEGRIEPSEVLMLLGEDDIDDTAVPRLLAAEADMSKIHFIETVQQKNDPDGREVRLDWDIPAISAKLEKHPNIKLIIIDPISNYLGDVSMVAEQEVRRILIPLKRLAEKQKLSIVIVMHLNKKTDMDAITRVGGAMAFIGVARCSWLFMRDGAEENADTKIETKETFSMLRVKNNLTKAVNSGLSYEIKVRPIALEGEEAPMYAPYVNWLEPIDLSADQALGNRAKRAVGHPAGPTDKMKAAEAFIYSVLSDGPKPSKWMIDTALNTENIKKDTLQTAGADLVKRGALKIHKVTNKWLWELIPMNEGIESDDRPAETPMDFSGGKR